MPCLQSLGLDRYWIYDTDRTKLNHSFPLRTRSSGPSHNMALNETSRGKTQKLKGQKNSLFHKCLRSGRNMMLDAG
jgi:hypothetical protein